MNIWITYPWNQVVRPQTWSLGITFIFVNRNISIYNTYIYILVFWSDRPLWEKSAICAHFHPQVPCASLSQSLSKEHLRFHLLEHMVGTSGNAQNSPHTFLSEDEVSALPWWMACQRLATLICCDGFVLVVGKQVITALLWYHGITLLCLWKGGSVFTCKSFMQFAVPPF